MRRRTSFPVLFVPRAHYVVEGTGTLKRSHLLPCPVITDLPNQVLQIASLLSAIKTNEVLASFQEGLTATDLYN